MNALHEPALEAGVVRYLITRGHAAKRCPELRPEDMLNVERARMLAAVHHIAQSGDFVTAEGVIAEMMKRGHSSAPRSVHELLKDAPKLEGIAGAIDVLRDHAKRRRLREPLLRLLSQTEDGDLGELRAGIRALAVQGDAAEAEDDGSTSYDTRQMLAATMDEVKAQASRPVMEMGPLTPLARSMMPGDMVTIGGRTNAGKSQLALFMGHRYWAVTGSRIGIVSLEDRAHLWGDRALAHECGVSPLSGMTLDDHARAGEGVAKLVHDNPYHLEVMDRADVSDVERAMLRCIRVGCGMLVVDYVQEIRDRNATKGATQNERYSDIAARIKMVAKRAKLPLLLCSQLSRPAKSAGKTPEPTKHDLKGSGDLENISEAVVLLWKANEDDSDTLAKVVKLKGTSKERARVRLLRGEGGMITRIERQVAEDASGFRNYGFGTGRA